MGETFIPISDILTTVKEYESMEHEPSVSDCGAIGIYSRSGHAPEMILDGLAALQHRGQDAAGIAALTVDGTIKTHIDYGLVPQVITQETLQTVGKCQFAIGHNRYRTNGSTDLSNAQPVHITFETYSLDFAHNGNFFDTSWFDPSIPILTPGDSDSNKFAALVVWQRSQLSTWKDAIMTSLDLAQGTGSISGVAITNSGELFGMTDPYGNRPLCIARTNDGWVIASESDAGDMLGAFYVREVKRGEIVHITRDGILHSYFYGTPKRNARCILEDIYFSRPDSFDGKQFMQEGRDRTGEFMAQRIKEKGIHPDVVAPVFDSGGPASKGMARMLDVPIVDAIITSHFAGRSFILPDQDTRASRVRGKFNVIPLGVQKKKIAMGDDSLIRNTTAGPLVRKIREAGAQEIHVVLASDPVVNPCNLGVDMKTKEEQAASPWASEPLEIIEAHMAAVVGANSVTYTPTARVTEAFGKSPGEVCFHCFGGPHPMTGEQVKFSERTRQIIDKPRIVVLISGNGTNLQKIIDGVEAMKIDADIVGVISNNPDADGLVRAQNHSIPTFTISSKGRLKNPSRRVAFEQQLLLQVQQLSPDVIVMAGWMVVLSDDFLQPLHDEEVAVLNLHPAMLPRLGGESVQTRYGTIPAIRGVDAIHKAYDLMIPASGVTVHQVLSGNSVDVGPVILRETVKRVTDESFESWEARMHEAEYRVLPAALQYIIHVLKHNIDISKGTFPW